MANCPIPELSLLPLLIWSTVLLLDTRNKYRNWPYNRFYNAVMHLKGVDGMANSVHPVQTASQGAV